MSDILRPLPSLAYVPSDPTDSSSDALPLLLLRDELAIDAQVGDVAGATRMLTHLSAIVAAGFAAHGVILAACAGPTLGAQGALQLGGAWAVASTVGFFASICACLPSCWFYGVVANVAAPSWRLAVELVRVQAIGAVTLVGLLPFWLAGSLALRVIGVDLFSDPTWRLLTHALPFLAAFPGVFGLYRVFVRMRIAAGERATFPAALLTVWWITLFQFTCPMTISTLYSALRP
jgi:hypothetical protein